ncbi:MAG TPA: hypothetical protein VMN57_13220 [Anaerolineales bacterium]|nr:hypothetical protein [Anaerolineales bacterium]
MRNPRADTIRASEIGSYLFCRRAWWYNRSGRRPDNQAEMQTGARLHARHGRVVLATGLYRWAGYAALLAALALLAVFLVDGLL